MEDRARASLPYLRFQAFVTLGARLLRVLREIQSGLNRFEVTIFARG